MSLYEAAELYDVAFSWDAAPEAAFYDRVLPAGPLLDVGCGTGRVLAALVARGRAASGLEASEAMAALARARGLCVTVGDMRRFGGLGPYAGALSHLSTFRYLMTDADVTAHLDAMAAALPAAGARYAIDHDLIGPDYDPAHPGQTWTGRRGDLEVTATWRALSLEGDVAREEAFLAGGGVELRVVETLRAWTLEGFGAAIAAHRAFAIAEWWAPPFEIAAPFVPVPWTPRAETRRVVTILERR
jgi:SAM-dependent methyltransferase